MLTMKKHMYNRIMSVVVAIVILSLYVTGCAGYEKKETGAYIIYCLDRDENTLKNYEWESDTSDKVQLAGELLEELAQMPKDVNNKQAIRNYEVEGYEVNGDQITIDVSENYKNLTATTEILTRAAIVRTMCQIDGIAYVSIRCHGDNLLDALGVPVGLMSPDQFVDNEGNEINSYECVKLTLYLACVDGMHLKKAIRTVEYNSNISSEKLVVEQLIAGTNSEGFNSTINPQTKLISATIKDGICYVTFDSGFLLVPEGIHPETTVYSVVNSLVELPNVNKVQISIEDNAEAYVGDNISLDVMFERNLDIVE